MKQRLRLFVRVLYHFLCFCVLLSFSCRDAARPNKCHDRRQCTRGLLLRRFPLFTFLFSSSVDEQNGLDRNLYEGPAAPTGGRGDLASPFKTACSQTREGYDKELAADLSHTYSIPSSNDTAHIQYIYMHIYVYIYLHSCLLSSYYVALSSNNTLILSSLSPIHCLP